MKKVHKEPITRNTNGVKMMIGNYLSRIKLDMCKESLTAHGGFVLLSELWDALGVSRLVDANLP